MATWIIHLMIADRILIHFPELDTRGFCVGNIAPDCNVESEDWSYFTPFREVTHWMSKGRKASSDSESFFNDYFLEHTESNISKEHYSFLLGYYVHLITDAEFQWYIREDNRVKAVWSRINENEDSRAKAKGCSEDWDSVKKFISISKEELVAFVDNTVTKVINILKDKKISLPSMYL